MEKDILIIPDTHGRTFWKDAVEHSDDCETIIFLGDYLDPYPHEKITSFEAKEQLQEILEFAEVNPRRVIMLLGNHDMHYVSDTYKRLAISSRFDTMMASDFHQIFKEHLERFQLSWECTRNEKRYLFTHAGISKGWYQKNRDTIGELTTHNLNKLLYTEEGIHALGQIGYERGGNYLYGSIVWADLIELGYGEIIPNTYQIFGHDQQHKQPIITSHWACLDCRRAFKLSQLP